MFKPRSKLNYATLRRCLTTCGVTCCGWQLLPALVPGEAQYRHARTVSSSRCPPCPLHFFVRCGGTSRQGGLKSSLWSCSRWYARIPRTADPRGSSSVYMLEFWCPSAGCQMCYTRVAIPMLESTFARLGHDVLTVHDTHDRNELTTYKRSSNN